jgi:hypothetical protein
VTGIPALAREVLTRGVLCHLAAPSPRGPHVTPVVFVLDGDRLWGTTGRGTTKAARWRGDPVAGGLVRAGRHAVTFRGAVTLYDTLDPSTWLDSLARGPQVARASARFTIKNARFFAGYTRDVAKVPLAWTPPARVLFSVDLQAMAVLDGDSVLERWGSWARGGDGHRSYRRVAAALRRSRLPAGVRDLVGRTGRGTLGLESRHGPVVLPARWMRSADVFLAVLPRRTLSLAGAADDRPASLVIDHASSWRASKMRGVLLRGDAAVFDPGDVVQGRRALADDLGAIHEMPDDPAVVRLRPRSAVWWVGWSSGTVSPR